MNNADDTTIQLIDAIESNAGIEAVTDLARQVALEWHSGQFTTLYGFGSTGDWQAWGPELLQMSHRGSTTNGEIEALVALTQAAEYAARRHLCGPVLLTIQQYYMLDSVYEGSADYHRVDETFSVVELYAGDEEEGVTLASYAADLIQYHGASEDCGGWWVNPDGSYTVDYGTGEECETSVHPYGFTPELLAEVNDLLAARTRL